MTNRERRAEVVTSVLTARRRCEESVEGALDALDEQLSESGLPIRNDTRAVWIVSELIEAGWLV